MLGKVVKDSVVAIRGFPWACSGNQDWNFLHLSLHYIACLNFCLRDKSVARVPGTCRFQVRAIRF